MYLKPSKTTIVLLILMSILSSGWTLQHQQDAKSLEDRQYDTLSQQQKGLEDYINGLVLDMIEVQKNVSKSTNSSDKVLLLESAIISERQRVFNIQNQVIPPFSLSRTACLQLTNQQKMDLLDNITATKAQLTQLQQDIFLAPKCDKINGLEKDTLKQMTLLDSLKNTILTQCQSKSILTPTIFQTNIYADNWILGDQHIDDLVEQYYQRNIRYNNITNCPLQQPFFNGQQCIMCHHPDPVFNILTKQCTKCPDQQEPDPKTRKCAWRPHYTNFSSVENWATDGAAMPNPDKKLVPCPPIMPYYNGKKCQACVMPFYWSIKQNSCQECPLQMVFDLNSKRCEHPSVYYLTRLQGTKWVTNDCNLTRIVQKRIQILEVNKTKKYYKYCPEYKPYYDGIACISCPRQFNIDTRKCVQSPSVDKIYNQNMKCYTPRQYNKQTDPKSDDYTTRYPLKDSITPNCKKARPYWDGLACVDCLQPFPIFSIDTKKCGVCQPMQYYNNTQHKCLPRQKIYVSTNNRHLMATQAMSIEDYHAQIRQTINDHPQAVVLPCQSTQYSDYTQCITCQRVEYFNVQTKQCVICDGTLNQTTKVCIQKAYIYTNFNNQSIPRIVSMENSVEDENATIKQNLQLHQNARICQKEKPFSDGKQCFNCAKQSFDYSAKECVPVQCNDPNYPFYNNETDRCEGCPDGTMFQQKNNKCQPIRFVTNVNAIYFYIQEGDNYTKNKLEDQIYELEKNNVVIPCEASHPYFNGQQCIDCAITRNVEQIQQHKPFFNLKSLQCEGCQKFDNKTHRCLDEKKKNQCEYPTPFLTRKNTCQACPQGTFWLKEQNQCGQCDNGAQQMQRTQTCGKCPEGQVYNQSTQQCQNCPEGSVFNQFNGQCREDCGSQAQWNKQSQQCVSCPEGQTVDEDSQQCECPQQTMWIQEDQKCIQCPQNSIWSNQTQVCQCSEDMIWDEENNQCTYCPKGLDWDNSTQQCICPEGSTWQADDKQCIECPQNTTWSNQTFNCECPEETEWDQDQNNCVECIQGTFWNPQTSVCEECSNGTFWIQQESLCRKCENGTVYNEDNYTCISSDCGEDGIFNEQTQQCETWISNVNSLGDKYIEQGNGTLDNMKKDIEDYQSSNETIKQCPQQTPYYSSPEKKCIVCEGNQYFNLLKEKCVVCTNYDSQNKKCKKESPRFNMNIEDFYGTIFS